jgi:hypothetical protein
MIGMGGGHGHRPARETRKKLIRMGWKGRIAHSVMVPALPFSRGLCPPGRCIQRNKTIRPLNSCVLVLTLHAASAPCMFGDTSG